MVSIIKLSTIIPSLVTLSFDKLSFVTLSVFMPNAILPNVDVLSVVVLKVANPKIKESNVGTVMVIVWFKPKSYNWQNVSLLGLNETGDMVRVQSA